MYFIIQVAVGHNYIHYSHKKQNIRVSDHFNVQSCFVLLYTGVLYNTLFEGLESFLINWGKVQLKR
jgi:hypothetical protein